MTAVKIVFDVGHRCGCGQDRLSDVLKPLKVSVLLNLGLGCVAAPFPADEVGLEP